ncbi:conserved protein of unknown function [Rhodovastum atsumiense]|nr:hypothetical protein [Rhodovastum atsumiense]CAH2598821.1 conserved protein of unknown function [Rhodovastum atsumiense]
MAGRPAAYAKEPKVPVIGGTFERPFNRRVFVINEVTQPPAIACRDHIAALDVMIMVRRMTDCATDNGAFLVRGADLLKHGDVSQNMEVEPNGILVIPQGRF